MILSAKSIKEALAQGVIKIEPYSEGYLKEASYTFTLEHELMLQPGGFKVVTIREKLTLAPTMSCMLSATALVAEMGLDVLQSSVFVEPGSDGQLKLEIKNNGSEMVVLPAGLLIVKGVFMEVT